MGANLLAVKLLEHEVFIDVGLVFATDGRISAYDLLILKDDRAYFPDYSMAPVVRRDKLQQHPSLRFTWKGSQRSSTTKRWRA